MGGGEGYGKAGLVMRSGGHIEEKSLRARSYTIMISRSAYCLAFSVTTWILDLRGVSRKGQSFRMSFIRRDLLRNTKISCGKGKAERDLIERYD